MGSTTRPPWNRANLDGTVCYAFRCETGPRCNRAVLEVPDRRHDRTPATDAGGGIRLEARQQQLSTRRAPTVGAAYLPPSNRGVVGGSPERPRSAMATLHADDRAVSPFCPGFRYRAYRTLLDSATFGPSRHAAGRCRAW